MTLFSEKISIFTPKIVMTFFSHRPGFFLIFRIFTVLNVVYDPFFTRKPTISEKNSLMTPFLLCSYFRAHPTTLLLKIWGGGCMGRPPTSNFGGLSPSPPLGLRLWTKSHTVGNIQSYVICRTSSRRNRTKSSPTD